MTALSQNLANVPQVPAGAGLAAGTKAIIGVVITAAVLGVTTTAVVPAVLLTRGQNSNSSSSTSSTSSNTTIYWSLDATAADSTNTYVGTPISSPTYFSTSNTQPFVAYGRGLNLISSSSQYLSVTSPFLDLTYKSFTIEAWIYSSSSYTGDYGIFGQCQCSTCSNQCLYFLVRGGFLFAGFGYNDITGSLNITSGSWYHVAFVYNYDTQQQILYLNGVQDTAKSSASAYQGTNGSITIGSTLVLSIRNYFNGYIDNVKITLRAKSSTEILNGATLTAYFSFDVPSPYTDSGPNGLNGTQNNAVSITGRVNQGLRFTGSSSYFYAYGFYQGPYSVLSSRSFSVSLWINPTAVSSCVIVQFAYSLSNWACHNLLGIWSYYGTTGQVVVQGLSWPYIIGSYLTTSTWTHISVTYSYINGLRLYVNGVYFGATGYFSFSNSGYITYLQLGYMYSCSTSAISNSAYQGAVDEVYVHSRELSQSDVTTLANP